MATTTLAGAGHRARARRPYGIAPTAILLLGALYCLLPVSWVLIAATKSKAELFSTSTFAPGTGLLSNISDLADYRGGVFWLWMLNTLLYAGGGALLSTAVSAVSGYALAKYSFRGRNLIFNLLIGGILVPAVVLAVPSICCSRRSGSRTPTGRSCCRRSCTRTASTWRASTPPPPFPTPCWRPGASTAPGTCCCSAGWPCP